MANVSPYQVDVTGTDDETFEWSVDWQAADGTAFPFADYAIEYSVSHDGATELVLDQVAGVTVTGAVVTFSAAQPLGPGRYEHGCRLRHLATDKTIQVFDGSVVISEGHF